MADKMMRVAGRGEDGLAKPLSVQTDTEGKGVLRVVDAAPFAYDPYKDRLMTESITTERVVYRSERASDAINAAGEYELTISPTEGYIATLQYIVFYIPAVSGATSGTQQFRAAITNSSSARSSLGVERLFNLAVNFDVPLERSIGQTTQDRGLQFDKNTPLRLYYKNNTNNTQSASREIRIVYTERRVN